MPILAEFGIEMAGEPEVFEVHNIVKPVAVQQAV